MVSEALSDKARRVLLKLDSGSLIGSAEKLRVSNADATTAVIVDADHSFQLGRLAEKDVQRLEDILLKMHAQTPGAAPLRTNSSAISSLKRKASDLYQVRGPVSPPWCMAKRASRRPKEHHCCRL